MLTVRRHTLVATTERGEARREVSFELPARRWAVIDDWNDGAGPKQPTWRLLDESPVFD